jgi:hypothetical protein
MGDLESTIWATAFERSVQDSYNSTGGKFDPDLDAMAHLAIGKANMAVAVYEYAMLKGMYVIKGVK